MKKSILLSLILVSSSSFAQTAGDVVKQLQSLQKNLNLDPVCNTCEAGASPKAVRAPSVEGIGPAAALELMNGPLKFIGRDLFPGSDQNRTCVYKSATAYVLYGNCMASKKEAAATDITVIDFNGGMTHYYIENNHESPISNDTRDKYDLSWTVDYIPTDAPGDLNVKGLMSYYDSYSMNNNRKGACFIGGSMKAKDMSQRSQCFGAIKGTQAASDWSSAADEFWREPGQKWYDTLKSLRKTVVGTKF